MKIAIIGAGISGLAAAWRLHHRHDVTLFEKESHLGGHAHTVDVEIDGEHHAIDTGFVVFNDRTYPRFCELIRKLGVASEPTDMSFSFHSDRPRLEYNGSSLNGLFAQRGNLLRPRFHRMLRDILRFNRRMTVNGAGEENSLPEALTLGQFLDRERYSQEFADWYLIPMGSAIWSCPQSTFADFPVRFVVEFFRNHGLLQIHDRPTWRIISGGSRTYVNALRGCLTDTVRFRTATPIRQVRRFHDHVTILPENAPAEPFDHVIVACHSDEALGMLADPSPLEQEILGAFPYQRNSAVLHTDTSVLPRARRAWASWNYRGAADPYQPATVTYCMNILQHIKSSHVFNVTLNDESRVDAGRILWRMTYSHPVFTTGRAAAQARHAELIGVNRTSYCGAYWRHGFHEDGILSADAVCERLERMADHDAESLTNGNAYGTQQSAAVTSCVIG